MAITASMVKELRDSTGAGMMDAKKALTETDGDMEAAVDWLRTKGLAKAAKKSGRTAAEGLVGVAVDGGKGVAVEVNSETDFVGKNAEFQEMVSSFAKLAMGVDSIEGLQAAEMDGKNVQDVLTDKTDLEKLVEKASQTPPLYQVVERDTIPTKVEFDNDRLPRRTIVEIETEDQVGLLYKVSRVFTSLNIDLSFAKILTEKGAAVDSFYIKNAEGDKITSTKEQKVIANALTKALTLPNR